MSLPVFGPFDRLVGVHWAKRQNDQPPPAHWPTWKPFPPPPGVKRKPKPKPSTLFITGNVRCSAVIYNFDPSAPVGADFSAHMEGDIIIDTGQGSLPGGGWGGVSVAGFSPGHPDDSDFDSVGPGSTSDFNGQVESFDGSGSGTAINVSEEGCEGKLSISLGHDYGGASITILSTGKKYHCVGLEAGEPMQFGDPVGEWIPFVAGQQNSFTLLGITFTLEFRTS